MDFGLLLVRKIQHPAAADDGGAAAADVLCDEAYSSFCQHHQSTENLIL